MYLISGRARGSARNSRSTRTATPGTTAPTAMEPVEDVSSDFSGIAGLDLGNDDGDEGDNENFDAADLNDPELLGELEALRSEMGLSSPPPRKKPTQQQLLQVHSEAAAPMSFDEDDEVLDSVVVTEEDMNDPGLLAELSQYGGAVAPPAPAKPAKLSPAPDNSAILETLGERAAEFKSAALAAKRQGDMDMARAMLMQMKTVQEATKCLLQNFARIAVDFDAMTDQLELQISHATRLAAHYLKAGDKPRALEFHRYRKRAQADLATVASYQANQRPAPPPFLHHEVTWTAPVDQRRDISVSELQVAINRVVSDGDLDATLNGSADSFVQWEIGWPRDRPSKAYARTIKFSEFDAGSVSLDYSHNIAAIDRQHPRPLMRWIERGRLVVEFYKYNGLLWGSQLIGRGSVPLADLRTKSEVTALVEMKAGTDASGTRGGKTLPGGPLFVDVAVRLRLPLSNQQEVAEHIERWIYIDNEEPAQPPQWFSEAKDEVAPKLKPELKPDLEPTNKPQEPSQPIVAKPAMQISKPVTDLEHKAPHAETTSQEMDDIALQLDSMDDILSNAVLELELSQIPARIQSADRDTASQLQELASAIQLRMSVVAAQVGAGAISIQDYMDGVTKEMATAKEWTLMAKRGGRKDLAVRALKRAKAMQNELSEMQSAMEANEE
ncbi:hypothetical protein FBU59_001478 [Linderina macrospora]|uniref:Uncharacterized protein n=1 Tax=Linderina macrospora TaxID=4868 RepID=A0ACC1JDU1_9FUNG|nr:hypothetical protein FBU59_001478 [Linderina macrospora]